jgi:hypothetical protein
VKTSSRLILSVLLIVWCAAPQSVPAPDIRHTLASISPDSLRANLSFIASDLLEGRDTPSRGLDIAAEYIAAQFRKNRLEPAGDDGYFQTAKMLRAGPPPDGFVLRFGEGARTISVSGAQTTWVSCHPIDISSIPVYKIHTLADLPKAGLHGKAVEVEEPDEGSHSLAKAASALHPALFLDPSQELEPPAHRLIDPDEERAIWGNIPRLIVNDREAVELLNVARPGETGIFVSLHAAAALDDRVTVRNVAALLRGSDSSLRTRFVLVTAHYDHIGRVAGQINPGANDDGSGTVSVIEIAQALAAMPVHPKRSILFMLFFGEEEGSLGSRYYVWHPLEPLAATIADLNLEQLGRTDSTSGPQVSNATLTGFRYSTVTNTLQQAGASTGISVYETPDDADYFRRSDNLPFAERGIPAHTIVVALDFPGYHNPADVWQKIDYANLARVDRMIALAAVMLADAPRAPEWNRANPDVAVYLHGQ